MTYPTDDLTPVLTHESPARVKYGQGTLVEWDPATFANVVEWRGARLKNLPVRNAANALGFTSGITVSLLGMVPPGGGSESWWIDGQIITPGTGAAEQAIAFMQTELARRLSLEIIQSRIHQGVAGAQAAFADSTPGLDYVDHPQGAPARVSGVEVVTGVAIVMAFSLMSWSRTDGIGMGGSIAVDISGATTIPAGTGQTVIGAANDNGYAGQAVQNIGGPRVFTGLNPGLHSFEIKYRAEFPFTGSGSLVTFNADTLVVIAF